VLAVRHAATRAIASIRAGGGPVFLELQTYRFRAHSMFDPDKYRPAEEVEQWREQDPILSFEALLLSNNVVTEDDVETMRQMAITEIDAAVDFAESGSFEPLEGLFDHVHSVEPTFSGVDR
jgi:TPP-dependent pyruvate/acetoin dehydrogenase alpha subunit